MAKLDIAKLNSLQIILSDSKTALSQKGVTVLDSVKLKDIPGLIAQVPSGGGSQELTADDNQVKFRVKIDSKHLLTATVGYTQSVANDVSVDFGDGSAIQTSDKTGTNRYTCAMIEHTFPRLGEYVITLTANSGTLGIIGISANNWGSLLFTDYIRSQFIDARAYQNCVIDLVFGKDIVFYNSPFMGLGIRSLKFHTGQAVILPIDTKNLCEIVFSGSEASVSGTLGGNHALQTLELPACFTSIPANFLRESSSVVKVKFNGNITSIGANAFYSSSGILVYDFTACQQVPTLASTNAFGNIRNACKIIVPDSLVTDWKEATNWSIYYDHIYSVSDPNADDFSSITDDWDDIFTAELDGTYASKYKVGDLKLLSVSNGTDMVNMHMQIAAIDTDELADGSGKAKLTWICKDVLTSRGMNGSGSAVNGWGAAAMRTWLRETILPTLPANIRAAIKEVSKTYKDFTTSSTLTITDTIWIPSGRELFGGTNYEDDGVIYSGLTRTKYSASGTGTDWWLRSAYNENRFILIAANGSAYSQPAGSGYGVVFGFCT